MPMSMLRDAQPTEGHKEETEEKREHSQAIIMFKMAPVSRLFRDEAAGRAKAGVSREAGQNAVRAFTPM